MSSQESSTEKTLFTQNRGEALDSDVLKNQTANLQAFLWCFCQILPSSQHSSPCSVLNFHTFPSQTEPHKGRSQQHADTLANHSQLPNPPKLRTCNMTVIFRGISYSFQFFIQKYIIHLFLQLHLGRQDATGILLVTLTGWQLEGLLLFVAFDLLVLAVKLPWKNSSRCSVARVETYNTRMFSYTNRGSLVKELESIPFCPS